MARVAFIGLGKMGAPMARNLGRAGHELIGYDVVPAATTAFATTDKAAESLSQAVHGAEFIFTMLPSGHEVETVIMGSGGVLHHCASNAVIIDCSTIDVATTRKVAEAAKVRGCAALDAPVSGGVVGAESATLTFMVGGAPEDFHRAEPILRQMGKAAIHAGGHGAGQAAKICNNLMLGIQMLSVCEAFRLAEGLGLAPQKLFEIASKASGQCWSLTSYCPSPGLVPTAPSNRAFAPGFTTRMMLKDLTLAAESARHCGQPLPTGQLAQSLFAMFAAHGGADVDFSGIIKFLKRD